MRTPKKKRVSAKSAPLKTKLLYRLLNALQRRIYNAFWILERRTARLQDELVKREANR